ncbi:DUF3558 domain-containing protein [Nocardia callitridis]|uniref:DUF3558 domain-containing protein n=1 Tax=Nocardia callitridis TaxID=648753 RepID=A0ABP9JSJ8_9NOCA
MHVARSALLILLAVPITALSVGCSSENTGTAQPGPTQDEAGQGNTQSARPTLTNPKLQPPPQDKKSAVDSDRPPVVFDPCTWISDESIQRAGFDPSSRKRGDDLVAEYSFLTCDFSSPERKLLFNSGNATWDENLAKVGSYSEPITVNGRDALWVHDTTLPRTCQIDVRTKIGFVQISAVGTYRAPQSADMCEGLLDLATAIEPEIGKDN